MKLILIRGAVLLLLFCLDSTSGLSDVGLTTGLSDVGLTTDVTDPSSIGLTIDVAGNVTATMTAVTEEHIAVQKWRKADMAIKKIFSMVLKSVFPHFVRGSEDLDISSQCMRGLMKTFSGLKQMKLWAYKMLDASGKLPNGIFSGNINSFGDYDGCLEVDVPGQFIGQYCTVDISPPLPKRRPFVSSDSVIPEFVNFSRPDSVITEFLNRAIHYYRLNFRSSVCVPSTCSREDVIKIANKMVALLDVEFQVLIPNCETNVDKVVFSTSEIVIMIVLGLLLALGITATITDVTLKLMSKEKTYQEDLSLPLKCLLCFSFYTNTVRLLKKDKSPDTIKIFHGMKVITILWVILNHTYYYLNYQSLSGLLNAREFGKDIAFQFIANGFLNVETFFFISAVLVSYGVMKMKEKRLNIFLYIFRRFWRLTPSFMLVIASIFLIKHLGSGPVWKETVVQGLTEKCERSWWTNLIFINNFIPSDDMCMQWSWYIPVDTHLYFLSLLFLIPLKRNPKLAFMMNGLLFVSGIILSAASNIYYGLHPTAIYTFNHPDDINYFVERGYFRTYLHCSTYCVGLTVGYILATRKKFRIPLGLNLFGWLSATLLALSVLYGVYDWNQGNVPGLLMSTIYTCTNKLVWALALAWVTFACLTGNGGIATTILSWPAFVPFGRLTYMAYLIHPVIHMMYTGSTRTLIQAEHRTIVYMYFANVLLAFICAYGLSLLFESPFMALEKVIFSPRRPAKNSNKAEEADPEVPAIVENISNYKKSSLIENNGIYAIKIKQMEANG